jgi:pyrimidine-nucleoside phosphorylase
LRQTLESGRGVSKFEEWVVSQGGDLAMVRDPDLLPQAPIVRPLEAGCSGYVVSIDAMEIGLTAMYLGAGRPLKKAPIDHAVGLVLHKKVGDQVARGEPLFTLHANHEAAFEQARKRALAACICSPEPPPSPSLIHKVILGKE